MKVLPSITSITHQWEEKLREVKNLKLKEVCLFLTCLEEKERERLYKLLAETSVEAVPFVHLRSDMPTKELDFLVKKYKTEAFNIHSEREFPVLCDHGKYKKIIYIENTYNTFDEEELKRYGGICLDFSHLDNDRILSPERYHQAEEALKKYPIGCCHISAMKREKSRDECGELRYSSHHLADLSELDYLERYPLEYFAPLIAIELENSIEEQLKAKDYISTLIAGKSPIYG